VIDPGLLQSVLDAPDDDFPRLVLADWLDEQGDSERAEFIRTQVVIAATPPEVVAVSKQFADNVLVIDYVNKRWPKQEDIAAYWGIGVVTPIFDCVVSDKEIMNIEGYLASRSGMGRVASLRGRTVELVGGTPDELVTVQNRLRMVVGWVSDTQRDIENHRTKFSISPTVISSNGDECYRKYTPEAAKYDALRQQERELLTPNNVRAWTEGSWFERAVGWLVNWRTDNYCTVSLHRPPNSGDMLSKFRFHRGFVEEAWFREDEFHRYSQELRKSHPVKTVNQIPTIGRNAAWGLPDTLFGFPVVVEPAMSGSPITTFHSDVRRAVEMGVEMPPSIIRGEWGLPEPQATFSGILSRMMRQEYGMPVITPPAFLISSVDAGPTPPASDTIPPPESVTEETPDD